MTDDRKPSEAAPEVPILDEEPPEHVPGSFLSALPQFFVFPAILVVTLTAVYLVLRVLAGSEPESASALLAELRAAGPHARWQILHSLADGLRKRTLDLDDVPSEALVTLYETSLAGAESPAARATLMDVLLPILAHKHDPALTHYALAALDDPDEEVRLLALGSLGVMRDPASIAAIEARLEDADPRVRMLALGALANIARVDGPDGRARELVAAQLLATDSLVARNAALQLATLGDERARPFVTRMLQRESYASDASLDGRLASLPDEESRENSRVGVIQQFLIDACGAAARLGDESTVPLLQKLRDGDPSLKVKSAAIDALDSMQAAES